MKNFDVHHNEFYQSIHHDEIPPSGGTLGKFMIILYAGQTDGDFYSNIVRDGGNPDTDLILISGVQTNSPEVNLYNNLIYGTTGKAINVGLNNTADINIFNNSIYSNTDDAMIYYRSGTYTLTLKNNIFYQQGTGDCIESYLASEPTHTYNQYYVPNGSIGVDLGTGEISGNPLWGSIPSGGYTSSTAELTSGSPGIDQGTNLSGFFTVDIHSNTRETPWDLGASELDDSITPETVNAPQRLRIK